MKKPQPQIAILANSELMGMLREKIAASGQTVHNTDETLAFLDDLADANTTVLFYQQTAELAKEREMQFLETAGERGFTVVPLAIDGDQIALGPWTKPWQTCCPFCSVQSFFHEERALPLPTPPDLASLLASVIEQNVAKLFNPRSTWIPLGRVFRSLTNTETTVTGQWHNQPKDPHCDICNKVTWEVAGEFGGAEAKLSREILDTTHEKSYLSRIYHENSKFQIHQRPDDIQIHQFSQEMVEATLIAKKTYPEDYQRFTLPEVTEQRSITIEEAIQKRRSRRKYKTNRAITLEDLAAMLFFGNGITKIAKVKEFQGVELELRAAPSGGALYPIEIYFAAPHVIGLPPAIYYYDVHDNQAIQIREDVPRKKLARYSGFPDMVENAAAILFLTAIWDRNQWKYWERGYRVTMVDAGHIGQNIQLMATAQGLRCCPMMGYVDDIYNAILKVDGKRETVIYTMIIGGNQTLE